MSLRKWKKIILICVTSTLIGAIVLAFLNIERELKIELIVLLITMGPTIAALIITYLSCKDHD